MIRRMKRGLTCVVAGFALLATSLLAAQSPSSWQHLPDETVLAVRVNAPNKTIELLRERTRLGAELLTDERIEGMVEKLKEMGEQADFDEMVAELAKLGLKPEDFKLLGNGEIVFSLIMEERPQRDPLFIGLTWVEPGQEHAARFFEAIGKGVEEALKEDDETMRRVDFDLNGVKVMHLSQSEVRKHVPSDFWNVPPEIWEGTEEQINEFFRNRQEAYEAIQPAKVDQSNFMVAVHGGKLVMVNTFPQNADDVVKMREAAGGREIDFDEVTGAKKATALLGRFLQAQGRPAQGGFVARMAATPGLSDAMPAGDRMVEGYVDAGRLMRAAATALGQQDEGGAKVFRAMGLEGLGAAGFALTLDNNIMRSSVYVGLPAQRTGLLTLLEQRELPAVVPAWVPNDVASYMHASFDLGKAYEVIKKLVIDAMPEAREGFDMAEGGMREEMGITPVDLLGSVGTAHHWLYWGLTMKNPEDVGMFEPPFDIQQSFVWRPTNERTFNTLFDRLKAMGEEMGEHGPKIVEEQGFTGLRADEEMGMNVGFFHGRGFLTMTMGEGVTEKTLALLRQGQAANPLANEAMFRRAGQILRLRPNMAFSIDDSNKSMLNLREMVLTAAKQAAGQGPMMMPPGMDDADLPPEAREWMEQMRKDQAEAAEKLEKLIPTREEIDGVFGVSVGQVYVTRQGIIIEGAGELAPKR
ncbi:MAG: hypothetical protein JJU36_05280 [Phycisphaeraceae bacterium]|nr:hypothetical protein [Phycisphaeraceae bacterium]